MKRKDVKKPKKKPVEIDMHMEEKKGMKKNKKGY
jgi:hypothetical protein